VQGSAAIQIGEVNVGAREQQVLGLCLTGATCGAAGEPPAVPPGRCASSRPARRRRGRPVRGAVRGRGRGRRATQPCRTVGRCASSLPTQLRRTPCTLSVGAGAGRRPLPRTPCTRSPGAGAGRCWRPCTACTGSYGASAGRCARPCNPRTSSSGAGVGRRIYCASRSLRPPLAPLPLSLRFPCKFAQGVL
jgi:hypothetical protein